MAIVDLVLERDFDDEKVWQIARTADLKKQSALEVVEAWAIIRIWSDLLEKRFGKIQSIRHHSPPNDPPDLEIICAERVVELEHTRL
jgi:hypothetical protein